MFLNDAFDAQFDRQHRPERPIPSGAIAISAVWQWGMGWFALGLLCFGLLGPQPLWWACLLGACIFIYDAIHKIFFLSPVLMACCRFFLILTAGSVTEQGITGYSVWCALVLACYIVGLSYLARGESRPASILYWPLFFLAAPIILALIVNRGPGQVMGAILCGLLILWILQSLRHTFWSPQPHPGRSVGSLLAGIVLVDLLSVGGGSLVVIVAFLALFALALFFQRFIPAT
jgi:4-hydroxybenzoate polyprenyltransferase